MSKKQRTLKSPFSAIGKGLHTGVKVSMTVNPATENSGILFCRIDLDGSPIIEALADNVVETSRSTVLAKNDVRISTVEHIMAALWGCGVDNALIEIDAEEVPIHDGSADEWVRLIEKVGIVEQSADREYYDISSKLEYQIEASGVEVTVYPDDRFSASVNVDYNSDVVGHQFAALNCIEDFAKEIAPSRTFVFLHELEPLIKANLIKGGDVENAIVIVERPLPTEEARKIATLFGREEIAADKKGYLNNLTLRFHNEVARHKMLDLIGDLALVGRRINGKVFATRPGHKANTELAKIIRRQMRLDSDRPPYIYDTDTIPLMDINQIKEELPHRPPFLLVDKVMEMSETSIIGVKQVTMNEPFFVGHFPEEPVMPGVLIVEAMAQCGGLLALNNIRKVEHADEKSPSTQNDYSTYFVRIDEVRFKRKVVPGDTLLFCLELTAPIRRGIVQMKARCFVGNALATEATLMAMISKND